MPRILFVVSFPKKIHSSARFRVELYEIVLQENHYEYDFSSFWGNDMFQILYGKGNSFFKIIGLLAGFCRRIILLTKVSGYDYIFILREATPIGPPFFEWICAKVFNKKIIYDFDDAIWLPLKTDRNKIAKLFKSYWKVSWICKWAYKVSVGNQYLYDYASRYNKHVVMNPTCVDTEFVHCQIKKALSNANKIIIGWTGTFSTLPHLKILLEVLMDIEKEYDFEFLVIADRDPKLPLKGYRFKKWEEQTEIEDLLKIDIGVMPLPDSEFVKGKCGFKLIQYMALGIPVLASPVGVNTSIVDENVNGFLCNTEAEWRNALERLLLDGYLRAALGKNGREKIEKHFSVQSNKENFLLLFS